jgi:hypothetical protein
MATFAQEFIDLAAELIGDEFSDFASNCVITKSVNWDPEIQYAEPIEITAPMIRLDFKESSFNGQAVKAGDYMLIGEAVKLTFIPSPDNCTTLHLGVTSNVKNVNIDPANATVILHVGRS